MQLELQARLEAASTSVQPAAFVARVGQLQPCHLVPKGWARADPEGAPPFRADLAGELAPVVVLRADPEGTR